VIVICDDRSFAEVARDVSSVLGVVLDARESSYWGDPYFSDGSDDGLKLTLNSDPQFRDGDPPEESRFAPQAPEAQYVLWDADSESEVVERLRTAGIDARTVASSDS
jgi:hypothetical protein